MSAARHLDAAPSADEVLAREIADVCVQIDRRLGNRTGTAEKGVWFWLWPPDSLPDLDVLTALHRDAVTFLHNLIRTPKETR